MANIKADEISRILREQIENYEQTVAVEEVGSVISVGDGIARVSALRSTFRKMKLAPYCWASTTLLRKAIPSSAPTRLCPCRSAKRSLAAW